MHAEREFDSAEQCLKSISNLGLWKCWCDLAMVGIKPLESANKYDPEKKISFEKEMYVYIGKKKNRDLDYILLYASIPNVFLGVGGSCQEASSGLRSHNRLHHTVTPSGTHFPRLRDWFLSWSLKALIFPWVSLHVHWQVILSVVGAQT